MKPRIYLQNPTTGRVLSSQEDGSVGTRDKVQGPWELWEIRSESRGVLTLTCPAHTHGRIYRHTMPEMTAESPMEGQAPVYVPFEWAG